MAPASSQATTWNIVCMWHHVTENEARLLRQHRQHRQHRQRQRPWADRCRRELHLLVRAAGG